MLKNLLGMKQRLLINTLVGEHTLGSNLTRFQTLGVRALTGLPWGHHPYLLPMGPGISAQAGAFSFSMSCVIGVPVSMSDHGHCWFGLRWVDSVPGLILDQPGDHWTVSDCSYHYQTCSCPWLTLLASPQPALSPWTCMMISTLGWSQLPSLGLPCSLAWRQWDRAGKGPALLAMAPSYPALREQLTLTCILIPLEEWSSLPRTNASIPLGSGSTEDIKSKAVFAQLVNSSCIVVPHALHPACHTQNCLLYRKFTPMLNLRRRDASFAVLQESRPQADCSKFSLSSLELSQCTGMQKSEDQKGTGGDDQQSPWKGHMSGPRPSSPEQVLH